MPAISKIRLTNVIYEEGNKRYNDEIFMFDGHNGAILLENGGGKTVLIQTALQAILPHTDLADRRIKNTLMLENAPAHIAIEWIAHENPRRYVVTAVSLFTTKQGLDSLRYVYEYSANDPNGIEGIPFVREGRLGKRTAERGELLDYYSQMRERSFHAQTFQTIKDYKAFLEEQHHIITSEWESIAKINSTEGGVEAFFDDCKSTNQLFDRLLIPTVESSIVGHEKALFANMFEAQHASFKNYKKLKETIEENQQIEQQLQHYTNSYEKFYQCELDYEDVKQRAKGIWNELEGEKEKFTNEQTALLARLDEWKKSQQLYEMKVTSFDIYREEMEYNKLEADHLESLAELTSKEEQRNVQQLEYYTLKLAELKVMQQEHADALKQIEHQLTQMDRTDEVEDYEEQLEKKKQALLGWYLTKIEALEKETEGIGFQLRPLVHSMEEVERLQKDKREKDIQLREGISKSRGMIDSKTKDEKKLQQLLLANPEQEQVADELVKWEKRIQYLEDELIRLQQEGKLLTLHEKEAEDRQSSLRDSYFEAKKKEDNIQFELSSMEKAQKQLIGEMAKLRPQWVNLEELYLVQDSIDNIFIETLEKLEKEKKKLLYRERIAYRFADDYSDQDIFYADPFLENQLSSWKNQVDFLVTGVEYIQEHTAKEELLKYPLWPVTLVTTKKEKGRVTEKLGHIAEHLQFPITVISTEEALSIHENEVEWVAPRHWNTNVDTESFHIWQERIGASAKEATNLREEKEKELKRWEEGSQSFHQFLLTFPFEHITSLQEELTGLKNQLQSLSQNLEKVKKEIEEIKVKRKHNDTLMAGFRDEKHGLDGKAEKGHQYMQIEKELDAERKKVQELEKDRLLIQKELDRYEKQLADYDEERKHLERRIHDFNAELRVLKQEEEFLVLQGLRPTFTSESKNSIKVQILTLEMNIRKITSYRGEWLAKRNAANDSIRNLKQQINDLQLEHGPLDEMKDFPGDGKQLMDTLWKQIKKWDEEISRLQIEVQDKASLKHIQQGHWNSKLEQFKRNFRDFECIQFDQPLEGIAADLMQEKQQLDEHKQFVAGELDRTQKELKQIEEAKLELHLFEEGHHFTAPDVVPMPISTEERLSFSYNRKKFARTITEELKRQKVLVQEERKTVGQEKRRFREFCVQHISDIKLQNMAVNGVENKQSYEELLDFKKNMLLRIERITRYANEHIRKNDEDLQLFINQIHSHLLTIVEELKQIPKMTKVKVGDDWKLIFSFTIPEWEEEVGKIRIREYIEWILKQLESERFFNEQGMEDDSKVRKEIETWLQSKQLLRDVMNNEVMKVSCRKVGNDNQVSTRSYSWELSNVWSGGEKWSKNMTLFLGILNYVAEKKKHIQTTTKRHRAVILDNPFGKASSDHVLSPVFFVAEQLGFQMIALTAHAEGKFLQDYFPVIYSCRLRASTDPNKRVMTKEKWLHHAYFQDHEPKTIERLGESEQLALFE